MYSIIKLSLVMMILAVASSQRTNLEVYNCLKKAVAKPLGSCRSELQLCYSNPDCAVDFDSSGCIVKPTSDAFMSCRKWGYRTP